MSKVWGAALIAVAIPGFAVGVAWIVRDHSILRGLFDMVIASALFTLGLARLRGWNT